MLLEPSGLALLPHVSHSCQKRSKNSLGHRYGGRKVLGRASPASSKIAAKLLLASAEQALFKIQSTAEFGHFPTGKLSVAH